MELLNSIDSRVFYFINQDMQNSLFDTIMPFITNYANWYFVIALFVIVILYSDYKKGITVILMAVSAIIVSDATAHNIIKPIVSRIRPCHTLLGVRLLAGCTDSFSFPSSHAANIFALSTVIAYEYKGTLPLMGLIAFAIAFSRIYLGVHYPSDVIAGGIFGMSCGALLLVVYRRFIPLSINNIEHR